MQKRAGTLARLIAVSGMLVAMAVPTLALAGRAAASGDPDTYSWAGATTLNSATDDYGYSTCPSNDTDCMAHTYTKNGVVYGEYDPWGYSFRNCTSYVAQKVNQVFGKSVSRWGNAASWASSAQSLGYSLDSVNAPQAGDIAVWGTEVGGGLGHVAYVASVNGNVATFDEYNVAETGAYTNSYTSANHPGGKTTPDWYIHVGTIPGGPTGNNRLHLAALGTDAKVYELDQVSAGVWSPNWTTIPAQVASTSMTATPDGLLHIAAVGTDGEIYVDNQLTNGAWGSWNQVPAQVTQVSIAATPEGKLHLAAVGTDSKVYELDQVNTGGPWSPNWNVISANVVSVSMTATPQDGKLHIAARGGDANIYITDQQPSNGAWGPWNQVPAQVTQVSIAATPEGKLHLAAVGTDSKVYELDQVNTGGPWSPNWNVISANVVSVSMTATPQDGKLHIAARGGDANIYITDQQPSNGAWGPWNQVPAQVNQVAIAGT